MLQPKYRMMVAAVVVSTSLPGISVAAARYVPGDFATIQACINAAVRGDVCVVAPGTYHEKINFLGKAITVRSSGGPAVTTIDATGLGGSVITCNSGEGVGTILQSFTITGGAAVGSGGGMSNSYSSPRVTYCTFSGNTATNVGGGMYNDHSSPSMTGCTFSGNTAATWGGGMYNIHSSPTMTDCTFRGNTARDSGGGMYNSDSSPTALYCQFIENTTNFFGGGMYNDSSSPTMTNCTFRGNTTTNSSGGSVDGGGGMYNSNSLSMTLTGCTFSGNKAATSGGGMYNYYSSPTMTGCTFSGNTATNDGGGMYNNDGSQTMTNCTFSGNTARNDGGGIFNYFNSPTMTNCTFGGNTATFNGGGMYNDSSSLTMTNCTFDGNTASQGGGLVNAFGNETVTNCTFSGNTANDGGGMYNNDGSQTMTNCTFSGNTARNDGGGIFNYFNSPTMTNCTFSGNTAATQGGGMYNRGGSPTMTRCEFTANTARSGGGMSNSISGPRVTNCTFRGNTATTSGGGMYNDHSSSNQRVTNCAFSGNTAAFLGGGMYNRDSASMAVTNCTFSGNIVGAPKSEGGGIYNYRGPLTVANCILFDDYPDEIVIVNPAVRTSIRFSDVSGGLPIDAIDGGGNIDWGPMFRRPPAPGPDGIWGSGDDDYGDLRLRRSSRCIDRGDPGFVPSPGETDLEGHARVLCFRVDMGAYEFGIGDSDCDEIVTDLDFKESDACRNGPVGPANAAACEPFDFDSDGDVDLLDFAGFQNIFGPYNETCCLAHAGPECANVNTEFCVCGINPSCCEIEWDQVCVDIGRFACIAISDFPAADSCKSALALCDGETPFNTNGASTDGSPSPLCAYANDDQVQADIWYDYTATCSGTLTVTTCNTADYDTKIAIYEGCNCQTLAILGCNDDAGGCAGFASELSIPVVGGNCYKVRVGGFQGAVGAGSIGVHCGP